MTWQGYVFYGVLGLFFVFSALAVVCAVQEMIRAWGGNNDDES